MIAIVGGGITGLALGWELARLGKELVILESSGRAGGVIRSGEVDGRVVDWGPQRLRLVPKVSDLVTALSLDRELLVAPADLPLHVFARGRLRKVPSSLVGFATTDALSVSAKIRLLFEPLTDAAKPEETVAGYFTRKLGREVYETLAGPLYGGLYASDPADMMVALSLGRTLRELRVGRSLALRFLRFGGRVEPPPACSFQSGMEALPRALGRSLGAKLALGAPVRSVRRTGKSWRLETDAGAVDAHTVVVTTPASVSASLFAAEAPGTAAALGELRYNPLAVVHLHAAAPLRSMGFQVALSERRGLLRGVTFNECLFGRAGLCTAYLGGSTHPEVERMSTDALATAAVREFRSCTGNDAETLAVEHVRVPAWDRSWQALERVELPDGVHVAANWWSRPGVLGRLAEAERVGRRINAAARTS
jgi:oxygen-dependent protoporphyrinogen oxidase